MNAPAKGSARRRTAQAVTGGARGFDGERSRAKSRCLNAGTHKGDGFEGKAAGQCAGIGRRRIGGRDHAAAKHAACRHVLLVRIAAGKLGGTLMGADDVAEGVELRSIRPDAEGECTERRLEQQQIGRDKRDRHAPSSPPDVQRPASSRSNGRYLARGRRAENRQITAAATRRDQMHCGRRLRGSRSAACGAPTSDACGRRHRPCRDRAI